MTSQVERAFQSGANNVATAMLDQAASTVTPNDFEVPADALKKALEHNNHPSTAESFSQGVSRVKESELVETSTSCRAYFAEQQVQVNPVDNVFYYMLRPSLRMDAAAYRFLLRHAHTRSRCLGLFYPQPQSLYQQPEGHGL